MIGATLSASIELTQSTMDMVVDINDMILNSSGAALGACLGWGVLVASRVVKAVRRSQQRFPGRGAEGSSVVVGERGTTTVGVSEPFDPFKDR